MIPNLSIPMERWVARGQSVSAIWHAGLAPTPNPAMDQPFVLGWIQADLWAPHRDGNSSLGQQ